MRRFSANTLLRFQDGVNPGRAIVAGCGFAHRVLLVLLVLLFLSGVSGQCREQTWTNPSHPNWCAKNPSKPPHQR